jgi:hypothetical protein
MRTSIAFAVAAALATFVTGCASTPTHYAAATEVPMYSQAEWVAMNTDQSVPEIPANEEGWNDAAVASTAGYSGIGGARFHAFGGSSAFSGTSSFGGGFARGSISAGSSRGASGVSGGHASAGGGHGGGHGGH